MAISSHEKPNKGVTDVWLTPLKLIKPLGDFDLDPCGWPDHWTAKSIFYLPEEDGLKTPWAGCAGRVWLNPPYSQVSIWMDMMIEHNNGVALVFARTDTRWFQKSIQYASSAFFPAGRIKFMKGDKSYSGSAGAPSVFLAFGEKPNWGELGIKGWVAK